MRHTQIESKLDMAKETKKKKIQNNSTLEYRVTKQKEDHSMKMITLWLQPSRSRRNPQKGSSGATTRRQAWPWQGEGSKGDIRSTRKTLWDSFPLMSRTSRGVNWDAAILAGQPIWPPICGHEAMSPCIKQSSLTFRILVVWFDFREAHTVTWTTNFLPLRPARLDLLTSRLVRIPALSPATGSRLRKLSDSKSDALA